MIVVTVVNCVLLFGIIIMVYKGIHGFINFINRNKVMDKKIDVILNKLENKEDN